MQHQVAVKRSPRAKYMRLTVRPPTFDGGQGRGRETGVSRVGRQRPEGALENRGFPRWPGGGVEVILTVPQHSSIATIEQFLARHVGWIEKSVARMRRLKALPGGKKEYRERREAAREFVHERLAHWNSFYGFHVGRVAIKDTKSLWGSCSRKGNLNFSYKLLFLPRELADYIIVHELCHLKEHNHSARFWQLVAKVQPEYRRLRRELRAYVLR